MGNTEQLEIGGGGIGQIFSPGGLPSTYNDSWYLEGTAYKFGVVFLAEKALTISRLAIRYHDYEYGTGPTYRLGLQGVDASGLPDGTFKNGGNAYVDITVDGTGNDGKLVWYDLGATYAAARGEALALVLQYQAGTCNGSNCTRVYLDIMARVNTTPHPYYLTSTGTWTKGVWGPPVFGYGSTTEKLGLPSQGFRRTAFSSDSNPNIWAVKFRIPAALCASFYLPQITLNLTTPAAGKTVVFTLYDEDGTTPLQTLTLDSDLLAFVGVGMALTLVFATDPLPKLYADTWYRLAIAPQQTATNIALTVFDFDTDAAPSCPPLGDSIMLSTCTNPNAWTDTVSARPIVSFLINPINLSEPPPDPAAVPNFPFMMIAASDGITPLTGATVTATVSLDGAEFVATANAPTEVADGLYKIDLDSADLAGSWVVLRLTADDAVTQHLTLQP